MSIKPRSPEGGHHRRASAAGRLRRVRRQCRWFNASRWFMQFRWCTRVPCLAGLLGLAALAVDLARENGISRLEMLSHRFETAVRAEDWERAGVLSRRLGRLGHPLSTGLNRTRFRLAQRIGDLPTQHQLAQQLAPDDECGCPEAHWWRLTRGHQAQPPESQSDWLHHLRCLQDVDAYRTAARTLLGWFYYRNQEWPAAVSVWQPIVRFDSGWLPFYAQAVARLSAEQRQLRRSQAAELIVEASRQRLRGNWEAARRQLEETLRLLPQSSLVRNNLACAVLQTQPDASELAAMQRLLLDNRKDLEMGWQIDHTMRDVAGRLRHFRALPDATAHNDDQHNRER